MPAAITTPVASVEARLRAPERQGQAGRSFAASLLLHAALFLVVLIAARQMRPLSEPETPVPVDVVFEGTSNGGASLPNSAPPSDKGDSPAPQPQTAAQPSPALAGNSDPLSAPAALPSDAVAAPSQPQRGPVRSEPETAPPQTATASPPTVLPEPPPAPSADAVTPSTSEATAEPAAPVIAEPSSTTLSPRNEPLPPLATAPAAPAQTVPPPTAIPEPAPVASPAEPRAPRIALAQPPRLPPLRPTPPEAPPRSAPRPAPQSAFPAPTEFSLGTHRTPAAASAARPHLAIPRSAPAAIDLSFSPDIGGGDVLRLRSHGKGDEVGPDWFNLVAAWWVKHRYYPDQAARLAQEGDVTLRLNVAKSGRVQDIDVEQRSGSPWLDLAALAVFRNAQLPPLPRDVTDPDVTLSFTIHYMILR